MVQPLKLVAFVIVMLAYLYVPISTIQKQERILSKGENFQFQPQPVDPYDVFRGKFIWLNLEQASFDLDKELRLENGQKVFAHLGRDTSGYTYFTGFTTNRPTGNSYIQTNVAHITNDKVYLKNPESLQKFYLNEKLAPLAEKKYRELMRRNREESTTGVVLDVKVYGGKALVDNLYFDGVEIGEYLKRNK